METPSGPSWHCANPNLHWGESANQKPSHETLQMLQRRTGEAWTRGRARSATVTAGRSSAWRSPGRARDGTRERRFSRPPRGRRTCEAQLPSLARSPRPQTPAQACTPRELPRPRQHASSRQHARVSQRGSDTCTYSWFARIQSASCFLQRASCTARLLLQMTMTASLTQTL